MDTTLVRLAVDPEQLRLLVTQGLRDIGKIIIPRPRNAHPRAAATLLEGLSLLLGERLAVVVCVDDRSTSLCLHGLLDGLGYGRESLYYEVGVAAREPESNGRAQRSVRLKGVGDFRDLRQVHGEWSR